MEEGFSFSRKRTLVSTNPTRPACKIHALSNLDLLMENHHLEIIYYYKTPVGSPLGEITAKIRENLSEMLSYFPIVIGRLMKNAEGKWVIKCNDAGLRLIEARVKGNVEIWLENVNDEKEKKLVHWEDMLHDPYLWSTFYLKVTEFEEGGLAVGLSCAHMLSDPICATIFLKALSQTMLCGQISIPPHFHPLPQHRLGSKKSFGETNLYINNYKSFLGSPSPSPNPNPFVTRNYKTVALEFKHDIVQSCMRSAKLNGPDKGPNSSGFVALVGLLWICISRVKGTRHGLVDMSICSDMRKVLGLDQGYFGNCMIYDKVHGNGIGVDDLVLATKAIREAIGDVNKEDMLDLIAWLEPYERPIVMGCDNLTIINLENIDPYSSMFIEGYEPVRVSYYSESAIRKETVFILPPRPHEGRLSRIAMVTLPSDEVVKLCEDKRLSRYSPIIVMGPK